MCSAIPQAMLKSSLREPVKGAFRILWSLAIDHAAWVVSTDTSVSILHPLGPKWALAAIQSASWRFFSIKFYTTKRRHIHKHQWTTRPLQWSDLLPSILLVLEEQALVSIQERPVRATGFQTPQPKKRSTKFTILFIHVSFCHLDYKMSYIKNLSFQSIKSIMTKANRIL